MRRLMGLRILHVIGGGDSGGAMTHLLPLLAALRREGCDVHLLCLGEGMLAEEASRRGESVVVLPMDHPWDGSMLGRLRRIVNGGPGDLADVRLAPDLPGAASELPCPRLAPYRAQWDVVHTHGMRANLPVRLVAGRLCPGFGGRRRPCLFTTVHSDLRLDYASSGLALLYQGLDRATVPLVDRIICVSDALRRLLVGRGRPAERLLTIHSGLELPQTDRPGEADRLETVMRLGTIARLVPVKDIDLLLETAAELRHLRPGVEVVIVGDGPEGARLEDRARVLGVADMARFVGRRDDIGPIMSEWDVYMVTSAFEGGVSMSVLEAMAAGLPVVTTAAGGVEEAVKDGETGFVVGGSGQDRGALAAALAERAAALLGDPDLRARMGAAGAQRVRQVFTVERTARATVRAYERCLSARGR